MTMECNVILTECTVSADGESRYGYLDDLVRSGTLRQMLASIRDSSRTTPVELGYNLSSRTSYVRFTSENDSELINYNYEIGLCTPHTISTAQRIQRLIKEATA